MVCIYCGFSTQVTNTRPQKRSRSTWRRRACKRCKAIFTTIESVNLEQGVQIRDNREDEPFLRDKLYVSIFQSCRHRESAISDATELTNTIIQKCLHDQSLSGLVEKHRLANISYEVLSRFDYAAATYYRAYFAGKYIK